MQPLACTATLARSAALLAACAFTLAVAASASANAVPDRSRSLPIRTPSLLFSSLGEARLTVEFTDAAATAEAAAPSVRLARGEVFRLHTCVKRHLLRVAGGYGTHCREKTVDTRSRLHATSVAAPTVTATLARPAAGGSAYFSYLVSVSKREGGSFEQVATSWPREGLPRAAVGVPAVETTWAPQPASEGAPQTSGKTGGINTGLPDSMCMATPRAQTGAPGGGVSSSELGAGAPAYYEVGQPTGAHAGQPPKGVMLVIHGGGWHASGPGYVAGMRPEADRWRARGWRTLNVSYQPCGREFESIKWFHDRARELWGLDVPYCALGGSAGGNLALMLAAARPTVACVIDEGGPTDVGSIARQTTDHWSSAARVDGPRWVHNLFVAAHGPENAHWFSPARWPISARVLFAVAAEDPFVPYAQGTELRNEMLADETSAYVEVQRLAPGSEPWVHGRVSSDALARFHAGEERLVAPLVR
jgi:acetyl esterase/lipase